MAVATAYYHYGNMMDKISRQYMLIDGTLHVTIKNMKNTAISGPQSAKTDLRVNIFKIGFIGTKQFFGSCR